MLNIFPQFINNFLISTREDVVSSVGLVGSDKVLIQCGRQRHDGLELALELPNEVGLQDS